MLCNMKAVKGNFGYLKTKRLNVSLRTILFFGISLALFAAGYITTGKKENLLTVVAVLGCLPACKSLVGAIMLFRATGCSRQAQKTIQPLEGRLIGMYDMYFTSYQKNFAISHMIVEGNVILAFTESKTCDKNACRDHLSSMLKQAGFNHMTIAVTDSLSKYAEQLESLNRSKAQSDPARDDEVRVALYDISL